MALTKTINTSLLGTVPPIVKELKTDKEILEYFLYFFEITWANPLLRDILNMEKFLEKRLQNTKALYGYNDIDNERCWWLLILLVLNEFSKNAQLSYSSEIITMLVEKIKNLELKEIERYVNEINFAIFNNIGESMSIRPSAMALAKVEIDDADFILKELLNEKELFERRFSRYIRKKNLNQKIIETMFRYSIKSKKYFNVWESLFDAFVAFFISMSYDFDQEFRTLTAEKFPMLKDQLMNIIAGFFKTFVENKEAAITVSTVTFNRIMDIIFAKYKI